MRHTLNYTVITRSLWIAISLLLIQQVIVASSTFWVARLIFEVQGGQYLFLWLTVYLGSLLFPYLPGALSLVQFAKAKIQAQTSYATAFASSHKGLIQDWPDKNKKNTGTAFLSGEAPHVLSSYIDFIYHFTSTGLNVSLNLIALAIVVDPLLLTSYPIGLLLAGSILWFQKRLRKEKAIEVQNHRVKWLSILNTAWDNILINNPYNMKLWTRNLNENSKRYETHSVELAVYTQTVSILMALSLFLPTFSLIIWLTAQRIHDLAWLSVMIVTLPRLFQVLSYSYEALFYIGEFPQQQAQFETVAKLLDKNSRDNHEKIFLDRVSWSKISINSSSGAIVDLQSLIHNTPRKGRYTLKGDNGSGKTSLMLQIKKALCSESFYLPPHHDLMFSKPMSSLSTGQKVIFTLKEILSLNDVSILILDEWDANLDKVNKLEIDAILEKAAERVCIIESRHKT